MLNSNSSSSNLETSVLDSLRPERVRQIAEEIFPELRDISGASTPEQRDLHVRLLEQRLLAERPRGESVSMALGPQHTL